MIALLDSAFNVAAGVPTVTVTLPGGAPAAGDLLIAAGVIRSNVVDRIARAGWTQLAKVALNTHGADLSYRVAQAGDPAAMEFAYGTNENRVAVARFGGSWGAAPIDQIGNNAGAVNPATCNVTPTADREALLIGHVFAYAGGAYTPGAGITEIDDGHCSGGLEPHHQLAFRVVPLTSGAELMDATLTGFGFLDWSMRAVSFLAEQLGGARFAGAPGGELW